MISSLFRHGKRLSGLPSAPGCRVLGRLYHSSVGYLKDQNLSDSVHFGFAPSPLPTYHRVVVTGLGFVTPFGIGVDRTWDSLLLGASSLSALERHHLPQEHQRAFDSLPSRVVGTVDHELVLEEVSQRESLRGTVDSSSPSFVQFASLAADEALRDARWEPNEEDGLNTGVCIGAGMSSTLDLSKAGMLLQNDRIRRISPFFVPRILVNAASGMVSMAYRLHGPNMAPSTACATGAHAIGDAFRAIQRGDACAMLAGGTESCVDAISLSGFSRMKALSTKYNDTPSLASRPFDANRDGFVLSEGACVLVLESVEHALQRQAPKIYCEVLGYGMSGDAFHITKPREDGHGASLAMSRALATSGVDPSQVIYLNAHATSTPRGDITELKAIEKVFSQHDETLFISSSKGNLGHMLGAAGSVEAAITALACHHSMAPPNINLDDPPTEIHDTIHLIQKAPQSLERSDKPIAVMSNSFGFGGTNTSLLFGHASMPCRK